MSALRGTLEEPPRFAVATSGPAGVSGSRERQTMKTVMGWIDKIVSSLAKRKVNKDEGRSNPR